MHNLLKVEVKGSGQTKSRNKIRIFNYIWDNVSISRTDISKDLNISAPTVTRIVESLIKDKFIKEVGTIETSVGRKPIQLEINKHAMYTIGISITKSKINIVLINLGKEVIAQRSEKITVKDTLQFLKDIEFNIRELLYESKLDKKKLLGIGIGTTGTIDYKKGTIEIWDINKKIIEVPLKKHLENAFGLTVEIDDNTNIILFGEYWFNNKLDNERNHTLVSLYCSEGIACSTIINGEILRENTNIAGKVGHMTVESDGKVCTCGQKGCLEAYSSIPSIENEYYMRTSKKIQFQKICIDANNGSDINKEILDHALDKIAMVVNNIKIMLNPGVVIISGDIFDYYNEAFDYLKQEVEKRSFNPKLNNTEWKKKKKTEFLIEQNAAALIYDKILGLD